MSTAAVLGLSMVVTVAAALPLRWLARRLRLLDHPGPRKLQTRPVPYLGGVAVLLGTAAGAAPHAGAWKTLALLAGATAAGLVDDVRGLGPGLKLSGQVVLAAAIVAAGVSLRLTHLAVLDDGLTLVWLVGITNAFNLLDNMDGLCATVAVAVCLGLALLSPAAGPLMLPLAGAAAGFLAVNLPPARMYLGDAGSQTIGFAVGTGTVLASRTESGPPSLALLGLAAAVAVFDTSLVIASRLLSGRPVHVGGLDHSSHRLLVLGWDRRLILMIAALTTAVSVLAAWAVNQEPHAVAWVAAPVVVSLAVAWLLLLRVDPYCTPL